MSDASESNVAESQIAARARKRIDALAERANEGRLTGEERAEYEAAINAADTISILKLKAQRRPSATG